MTTSAQLQAARDNDALARFGDLAVCSCGVVVRWITTELNTDRAGKVTGGGKRVPVAPYHLQGNWGRPLHGYGEGRVDGKPAEKYGVLYVFPVSAERAAAAGWKGGARLMKNPPATIVGFRPHWPDCPDAPRHARPMSGAASTPDRAAADVGGPGSFSS